MTKLVSELPYWHLEATREMYIYNLDYMQAAQLSMSYFNSFIIIHPSVQ